MPKTRRKCPDCGSLMRRLYLNKVINKVNRYVPFGLYCEDCGNLYQEHISFSQLQLKKK